MSEALKRLIQRVRNGLQIDGRQQVIGSETVNVITQDENGKVTYATGTTVPTAATSGYAKDAEFIKTDAATGLSGSYRNIGTSSSCYFVPSNAPLNVSVTATDDGTTTGQIPDLQDLFVTATSAGATKQIALPTASSAKIGRTIKIWVGSNGYELITPASSNNTINTVDSDGTNQLDVAANTMLVCTQVTATGWSAFQVAATTITVVAPDND